MIDKAMQWAISRIVDIIGSLYDGQPFYGSVTLRFEAGKLVRIEHLHSEKPPT